MARFDIFDNDDDHLSGSLLMDCPECGKSIELPIELDMDVITCPHCHTSFNVER